MYSIKIYLWALAFVAVVSIAVGHKAEKNLFLRKRQATDAAPPAPGVNISVPHPEVPVTTPVPAGVTTTVAPKSGATYLTPLTFAIYFAAAGLLASSMAMLGDF